MINFKTYLFGLLFCVSAFCQSQNITIYGKVTDLNKQALQGVSIQIRNSTYGATTSKNGTFSINVPAKKHFSLLFSLLSYSKQVKELDISEQQDSIFVSVVLSPSYTAIDTVAIYADLKPDTLVGSPKYSIHDFEFYEDKFVLLTAEKSLEKAELKLADASGKIITSYPVPREGGEAKEFYKDYMGFINLICRNYIYRINFYHDRFVLMALEPEDVNSFIKPIIDTINGKLIFTDYWKDYPLFNYFSYTEKDSIKEQLLTIEDKDLLHAYNFEYYSLKPREKLEARRLASSLHTDKRVVAALMSGFTKSMFYEPLYAPLFIVKDTVCVFDHYKDYLFHLNKNGQKIDSISISYNHPKNWQEWKHLMLKDDIENNIYAVYAKSGRKYIKHICTRTGKELGKYNLQFHSAEKLKIHDGYAYYIYRPFESTQEKFFYRELIKLQTN